MRLMIYSAKQGVMRVKTIKHNNKKQTSCLFKRFLLNWRVVLVIFLIGVFIPSKGQDYTYYSQYMFNGMAINPAYAGVNDFITLTGNIREQWVGMDGAPSTQTLSAISPILNDQFGLGLNIINDKVGVKSQQEVNVNYAYKLRFPSYIISLGLKVGFTSIRNNFNELYIDDADDVNFMDNSTLFLPVVGLGAYLKERKYYVGLSIPQLHKFVSKKNLESNIVQQRIIFLTGGYIFRIDDDFKIRPSVLTKTHIGGAFEMDLNANLFYKEDYCFGISYKSLNTLAIILEIGINKTYYIGYSYDIATSNLIRHQAGTHEFSVNVYLNRKDKTTIVNPRYFKLGLIFILF